MFHLSVGDKEHNALHECMQPYSLREKMGMSKGGFCGLPKQNARNMFFHILIACKPRHATASYRELRGNH